MFLLLSLLKDTATLGQIAMDGTVENIETFWYEDGLLRCVVVAFIQQQKNCRSW